MSNDLISRSALKEEMKKCNIADFIAVQSVLDIIDNAPTVETTKRKKTKKVVKRVDGTDWDSFED